MLLTSKLSPKLNWTKTTTSILVIYSGFLFYSGIAKYLNLMDFAFGMTNFSLFSAELIFYIAYIIPAIEIILGIMLLINKTRKISTYGTTALLIAYSAYLTLFKHYAYSGWCSCGSVIKLELEQHLLFNMAITIPLLMVIIRKEKAPKN